MNDLLLNLFTGTDQNSPALMFPNLTNGIVYATDSHALITIPENELLLKYGTNEKFPNAKKIIDDFSKKLQSVRVNVADLAKELTKARIEVDKNSIECKECQGSGTVKFEYVDKKDINIHYMDGDCPICDGEGSEETDSKFARITLNMIEKEDGTQTGIYIDDLYFHPFQLYRLFMVAALKRVDNFEILYDKDHYGKTLSCFGNIKVLIMLMKKQ